MTYLALARKWRPKSFDEMVGQEHVVRALSNALDSGRVHHAYLFAGTRGVGKTTVARILAKALNCEQGVSAKPCGECAACTGIDAGRFFDLIEVDAASRTKVDDTRELLENVQYTPTSGRYKVYLIDEVHMLSNHSFNALLKNVGGATAARQVSVRDHQPAEIAGDCVVPLPAVQPQTLAVGANRRNEWPTSARTRARMPIPRPLRGWHAARPEACATR